MPTRTQEGVHRIIHQSLSCRRCTKGQRPEVDGGCLMLSSSRKSQKEAQGRNDTARTDLTLSAKRSCSLRWGDRGDGGDRSGQVGDWQTCSLPHRCSCFLLARLRRIPLSSPPVLLPRWPLFLQSSRVRRAVAERLAWIGRNGKTSAGDAIQKVK